MSASVAFGAYFTGVFGNIFQPLDFVKFYRNES